jgi:3-hydroxybutyryl-CoA dehydrogenase
MSESAAFPSTPTRIGVVGCGLMGSGIAEVAARAGLDLVVVEADESASKAGRGRIESSLATGVDRGKLEAADMDAALGRIAYATDPDQLADRELVIEAVVEDEATKVAVFERVDRAVESADAILASNTSSIPIMKLAMATRRPEAVVGMHFFNPVPVLALVELVPSLLTGRKTGPASWSTPCSSPTCCRPFACSSRALPRPTTSTPAWSRAAPTRWARCVSPI